MQADSDKITNTPEVLAPAGSWASLTSAVEAGCDAVYFGVKGINMRHGASNFDVLEIKKVMKFLHENGKKGYLTLNVTIYDDEILKVRNILTAAHKAKVDAVILWDMAALSIAKELGIPIHLSTQASVSNIEAVRHYASIGVQRIVLARECLLDDIKNMVKKIKEENIPCEIETFVHGAMCVSISGRCFLSQLTFSKSANRGECLQPCRREYSIIDLDSQQEGECEYILGRDYILSPKDLCTIKFIDRLIDSGIASFKIEGRMRSPEYVSKVTKIYCQAIDLYNKGELTDKIKEEFFEQLKGSFNRGFSSGFYLGKPEDLGGTLEKEYEKTYVGDVLKYYKKIGVAEILVTCCDLKKGQEILITGNTTPASFAIVDEMQIKHETVDVVPQGTAGGIRLPFHVKPKDKVFLWKKKS